MAYLGNSNLVQNFTPAVDYFNGNGSTRAFTLSRTVGSVFDIQAFIENVPQNPSSAFTVAGNIITFDSAPPSGTNNIYVRYTSPVVQLVKPAPGTVGPTELNSAYSLWNLSGSDINYTAGNVGIGTSSPADALNIAAGKKLRTTHTGSVYQQLFSSSSGNFYTAFGDNLQLTADSGALYLTTTAAQPMVFQTSNTDRMRITSGGDVGIGTSAPQMRFQVNGVNGNNGDASRNTIIFDTTSATTGVGGGISFGGYYNGTSSIINDFASIQGFKENSTADNFAGALRFTTRVNGGTPTERMRIDSNGFLIVNGATVSAQANFKGSGWVVSAESTAGPNSAIVYYSVRGSNGIHMRFQQSATTCGDITTNGTGVTYGTNSDYRLKENIVPMTDALAKVSLLKPCTYRWKLDGSDGQGFIAHELQAVVPECVTGEKDTVDADGKPVYQGVDTSFLVATLTAAIQEQQAIIEDLKTRIEILENK
jgi:hypothetical protein